MTRRSSTPRPLGFRVLSALCALAASACPPPQPVAPPGTDPPLADAGDNQADASPAVAPDSPAADPPPSADDAAPAEQDPCAAAFRRVLAAIASGSARSVRALVPSGGTLVLLSHVCRKPLYGVGTCRDERSDVDRQQVRDGPLAPWQDLLSRAAAADPPFASESAEVECSASGGDRSCRAVVRFGRDECRGDLQAVVTAVLRGGNPDWTLVQLGYEEEILLCD